MTRPAPSIDEHPDALARVTALTLIGGECVAPGCDATEADEWRPAAILGLRDDGTDSYAGWACSPDCAAILGKPVSQRRRDVPSARELLTRQFDRRQP